jgi:hypothetical protein
LSDENIDRITRIHSNREDVEKYIHVPILEEEAVTLSKIIKRLDSIYQEI